jgi:hypothetical protein
MSEPVTGLASSIARPVGEALQKHNALPPDKKNANRAYLGAFLLGVCGYLALTLDAADYPDGWKIGFAAVFGWGLLLLIVGWRGSRGRRELLGAIFAVAIPAGGFFAVMNYAPELLNDLYVRAFCCGVVMANAVRFWIDIRGPGGGTAEKQVHRQIAQHEFNWKPAKRH